MIKFTRKRLNQKKNQILDCSFFYFLSYGHFCDVITPISYEFFTKTHLWPSLSFLFPNKYMLNISHWNRSINEDFSYFQRGLFNKFLENFFHFYFWILIYPNYRIFYRLSANRILKLFSLSIVLNRPEVRICYSFLAINFLVVTPRSIFCVKQELVVRYF